MADPVRVPTHLVPRTSVAQVPVNLRGWRPGAEVQLGLDVGCLVKKRSLAAIIPTLSGRAVDLVILSGRERIEGHLRVVLRNMTQTLAAGRASPAVGGKLVVREKAEDIR